VNTAQPRYPAFEVATGSAEDSWRILGGLNLYRILVATVLLLLYLASEQLRIVGGADPQAFLYWSIGYVIAAIAFTMPLSLRRPGAFAQLCVHVATDIIVIGMLTQASGGVGSGLGLLLLVPVAVAALVVRTRIALLFAAVAALSVLLEQTLSQLASQTEATAFTAAGLLGAMLFLVALAVYPYARRLAESEALAEQRGVDLQNLSELSSHILQQLRESIVVVDGEDVIRLVNETAARHLGRLTSLTGQPLAEVHPELCEHLRAWRAGTSRERDMPAVLSADGTTEVVPQIAPMTADRNGPLLVFLEDPGHLAERVQQLKLASLGRLSASIAHEIRNPVGAMSHAAQLLAESPALGGEERRLSDIITANGRRVSAIIDSVMSMSRREASRPQTLSLTDWLPEFAVEYRATHELEAHAVQVHCQLPELDVRMDPVHLHQVLWNLCDNAMRYASEHAGVIAIDLLAGRIPLSDRPFLEVADRGPGIAPNVAERLFEPFVTGTRGGTGLGLYLARELCESNGATLRYAPREGGGSVFRIVFADPERWEISAEPAQATAVS
jgi:two-component system sensor histidine kinase PilS (NtrC family)